VTEDRTARGGITPPALTGGGPLATHAGPYFGDFGGRFVPEALVAALDELDTEFHKALADPTFGAELARLHRTYTGRPSPLTEVPRACASSSSART
jgi:tryptophan synthase beta chain